MPIAFFPLLVLLCAFIFGTAHVRAAESVAEPVVEGENWTARFQTTYIWQRKPGFDAAYSGQNSLLANREKSYTFTTTAYLGFKPWNGGELYFNPEITQGVPFSNLSGMGGFPNGELTKATGSNPKIYRQRAFLRQTWNLGGESEDVESAANQFAGKRTTDRLVLTMGKFSVSDIFDDNKFAHDPRKRQCSLASLTSLTFDGDRLVSITYTEPAVRGNTSGNITKAVRPRWKKTPGAVPRG